tara:strand:+ start:405 stop:668 length:264 start_codon:yes stop_codon:yes gene_type:complete
MKHPIPTSFPDLKNMLEANPAWLDEAITTQEASMLLKIPVNTLTTWRSRHKGPGFLKLAGKIVHYQRRTLFDWMASQQQQHINQAEG